jgi:hypothetical protein
MKISTTTRILATIRRPFRAFLKSEVTHLLLVGFMIGAMGYVGIISDAGRAELISNVTIRV